MAPKKASPHPYFVGTLISSIGLMYHLGNADLIGSGLFGVATVALAATGITIIRQSKT